MSKENIAVVFDTNFVISHIADLQEINSKLKEKNYITFITQVSINERLSQKYLLIQDDYDTLKELKSKYKKIASIDEKKSFAEYIQKDEQYTLQGYEKEFPQRIISFNPTETTLSEIMDRVFKKIPPFINAANASDKGFKDTLLWFSLLDYFSSNKYDEVIFITDDKGFGKGQSNDKLCKEFNEITGVVISIHKNNHYLTLIGEFEVETIPLSPITIKTELSDIEKKDLRDRIEISTHNIMWAELYDDWGNRDDDITFSTNLKFDVTYIENVFYSLSVELEKLVFQNELNASAILDLDNRISDHFSVPIENVEIINRLHIDIKEKHNEYLNQFYNAVANKLNQNYRVPVVESDDDNLPF